MGWLDVLWGWLLVGMVGCAPMTRKTPESLSPLPSTIPDSALSSQPGEVLIALLSEVKLFEAPDRTTYKGNAPAGAMVWVSDRAHGFFKVKGNKISGYVPENFLLPYAAKYHIEHLKAAQDTNAGAAQDTVAATEDSSGGVWITLKIDAVLQGGPYFSSPSLKDLLAGTSVLALGYTRDSFKVRVGEEEGYVWDFNLGFQQGHGLNKKLDVLREEGRKKDAAEDAAAERARRQAEEAQIKAAQQELSRQTAKAKAARERAEKARVESIRTRYSDPDVVQKILDRKIWINMTSQMARDSWGEPEDINRTVTALGTREQWVYGANARIYLYFDNGILTAYQD